MRLHQQVIERIDDVIVQYHIFDINKPLMVVFAPGSEWLEESDLCSKSQTLMATKSVWGFEFFAKRQMNVIALNHIGKTNLFESVALKPYLDALAVKIAKFPCRIGYGISRGGYAIRLYGEVLKLDKALLLMPISSFDAHLAAWEPKTALKTNAPRPSPVENTSCRVPVTIIYDPLYRRDTLHKKAFENCVASYRIPGVGHRIPRALLDMGMLKKVVLQYRAGGIDSNYFYRQSRQRRSLNYYLRRKNDLRAKRVTAKRWRVIFFHRTCIQRHDFNLTNQLNKWQQSYLKRKNAWLSSKWLSSKLLSSKLIPRKL